MLQRQLIVAAAKPLAKIEPDAKAGAAYRKAEAERDAQIPAVYKKLPVGTFHLPASADEWKAKRPEILKTAVDSLGDLPPRPSPLKVRLVSREFHRDYTLEHVVYDNGVDSEIGALLLIPEKAKKPAPAILWLHSSTPNKAQIVTPNTNGGEEPLGEAFVHAGYVVMAPDAYWYGERAGMGPGGTTERDRVQEDSLHKLNLWMGRTLWGMFVRDDQIALDYLCSRPEVDKTRIGATGMSMGSTRSWWLAAVDDRVAATVGVACLTRYQNLIAHGQLRQHGTYYFTYGLLKHFDTEGVIALIGAAAVSGADRRPRRGFAGRRHQDHRAEGRRGVQNARRRGQIQERSLSGHRPRLHAADAERDAGVVCEVVEAGQSMIQSVAPSRGDSSNLVSCCSQPVARPSRRE